MVGCAGARTQHSARFILRQSSIGMEHIGLAGGRSHLHTETSMAPYSSALQVRPDLPGYRRRVTHLALRKHRTWEEGASTTKLIWSISLAKAEVILVPSTFPSSESSTSSSVPKNRRDCCHQPAAIPVQCLPLYGDFDSRLSMAPTRSLLSFR